MCIKGDIKKESAFVGFFPNNVNIWALKPNLEVNCGKGEQIIRKFSYFITANLSKLFLSTNFTDLRLIQCLISICFAITNDYSRLALVMKQKPRYRTLPTSCSLLLGMLVAC